MDNVQSSIHCFPLYIYIAKDNKDFYDTHLTSFFFKLNKFEDDVRTGTSRWQDGVKYLKMSRKCQENLMSLRHTCNIYGDY